MVSSRRACSALRLIISGGSGISFFDIFLRNGLMLPFLSKRMAAGLVTGLAGNALLTISDFLGEAAETTNSFKETADSLAGTTDSTAEAAVLIGGATVAGGMDGFGADDELPTVF